MRKTLTYRDTTGLHTSLSIASFTLTTLEVPWPHTLKVLPARSSVEYLPPREIINKGLRFRRVVADFSASRPWLKPKIFQVEFVVGKVVRGEVVLRDFGLSSSQLHQHCIFIRLSSGDITHSPSAYTHYYAK